MVFKSRLALPNFRIQKVKKEIVNIFRELKHDGNRIATGISVGLLVMENMRCTYSTALRKNYFQPRILCLTKLQILWEWREFSDMHKLSLFFSPYTSPSGSYWPRRHLTIHTAQNKQRSRHQNPGNNGYIQ